MKLREVKEINRHRIPPRFTYFWFCRWISIYLAWIFQKVPITPNQISLLGHVSLILAAIFFIPGKFIYSIVAVILMNFSILCDYLDGSLARIKNRTSIFVANFLDRMLHELFPCFIFIGISIGLTISRANGIYFLLGVIAWVSVLSNSYLFQLKNFILMRYAHQRITEGNFDKTFVEKPFQMAMLKIFTFPMKYLRFITLVFVLLNMLHVYLIFYALFLPFRTFVYYVFMYHNFNKMDKERNKPPPEPQEYIELELPKNEPKEEEQQNLSGD